MHGSHHGAWPRFFVLREADRVFHTVTKTQSYGMEAVATRLQVVEKFHQT